MGEQAEDILDGLRELPELESSSVKPRGQKGWRSTDVGPVRVISCDISLLRQSEYTLLEYQLRLGRSHGASGASQAGPTEADTRRTEGGDNHVRVVMSVHSATGRGESVVRSVSLPHAEEQGQVHHHEEEGDRVRGEVDGEVPRYHDAAAKLPGSTAGRR